MTAKLFSYLINNDFTAIYASLVFLGAVLAVVWVALMGDDPANQVLPEWDLRLRRFGVVIMVAGFILSVLFGGDQRWAPWPTMLIVIFGFDFYLGAAIFTTYKRIRIRDHLSPPSRDRWPVMR